MEGKTQFIAQINTELEELRKLIEVFSRLELEKLADMAEVIADAIVDGNVLFTCGNGGSAADAQHIAGELVGRFRKKPRGYKAFALTTNSSVVTAIANDFSFDEVFSRQLESKAKSGDVLLCLSTSGKSPNVVKAAEMANRLGVISLALVGKDGGELASVSKLSIVVPHDDFARIQEMHMILGHILCGLIEEIVLSRSNR